MNHQVYRDTHRDVFISSTTDDLKEHRKAAQDAVWRANMYPKSMDLHGASREDAIEFSLRLVDEAEIYVGIFAYRYGFIPDDPRNPERQSITEMEYRRAREHDIPLFIFIMGDEHPIRPSDIERDPEKLEKLNTLKSELQNQHVVKYFNSPEELGTFVLQALTSSVIQSALSQDHSSNTPLPRLPSVPLREVPVRPRPFYVHPYTQPHTFVGRERELQRLDKWANEADERILCLEAIGGVGKSALTWEWVRRQAPANGIGRYSGIVWWSFYEEGATMTNFITSTLAYVHGESVQSFDNMERQQRELALLTALREEGYLIVLDGVERIMQFYAGGHVNDDKRRQFANPEDDAFLRLLADCTPTKTLLSTRLTPRALQDVHTGDLLPGVRRYLLEGLNPDDALALMRARGIRGSTEALLEFLERFNYHGLALSVIAGRMINFRPAPGDFDRWYKAEGRNLRLSDLPLEQRRTHVLQYALNGLPVGVRELLNQIAVLREPVYYQDISSVNPYLPPRRIKLMPTEAEVMDATARLHDGLRELEERGLLEWERLQNRYYLPSFVRQFIRNEIDDSGDQRSALERLYDYLASLPPVDPHKVHDLDQLRHQISLYETLVGLKRYDEAIDVYDKQLKRPLDKLAAYELIISLLRPLFPPGLSGLPRLTTWRGRKMCLTDMATALYYVGQYEQSLRLRGMRIQIAFQEGQKQPDRLPSLGAALRNYASSLRLDMNRLATALDVCKLADGLATAIDDIEGMGMSALYLLNLYQDMGMWQEARTAYTRFQHLAQANQALLGRWQPAARRYYAELLINRGEDATPVLQEAAEAAHASGQRSLTDERELERLRGELALQQGDARRAIEAFTRAIDLARRSGLSDAALQGRLACAEVAAGMAASAKDRINDVSTQVGKARVHDLFCSAAEVYLQLSDQENATAYARAAYEEAWADGHPYVWKSRLDRAHKVLVATKTPVPQMRPFSRARKYDIPAETEIRQFVEGLQSGNGNKGDQ